MASVRRFLFLSFLLFLAFISFSFSNFSSFSQTLTSEIEILRTELDRETNKRKGLEKDKKKFNAEITQVVDDLNKMTAQRDVLVEDKIKLDREVEELKEKITSTKEMHEHEIAAIKIQQQNSVKDLSIRVKEITDTNQRLKRRTTVVENLLSQKGWVISSNSCSLLAFPLS